MVPNRLTVQVFAGAAEDDGVLEGRIGRYEVAAGLDGQYAGTRIAKRSCRRAENASHCKRDCGLAMASLLRTNPPACAARALRLIWSQSEAPAYNLGYA